MLLPTIGGWCDSVPSAQEACRAVLVALLATGAFNLLLWLFMKAIAFAAAQDHKRDA